MYRAKDRRRGRYELFDQKMRDLTLARVRINDELEQVIERDELRLYYQPIVSLQTGGILGVEALVRWQHPDRGIVLPGEFILAAEQTGMIAPIGRWVLTEACRQMSAWNRLGEGQEARLAPSFVAVNVSARQIDDETSVTIVERLLTEHQLTPSQLHLEITESVLLDDTDEALVMLTRLRDLGVEIVLDDFGTGYSSLSYVKRFPINTLKIDPSFIGDLGECGQGDTAIVEAILNMAKALGVGVVAEGVETHAQANLLLSLQCHRAQGWLYAPALPAEQLTELLSTGALSPSVSRAPHKSRRTLAKLAPIAIGAKRSPASAPLAVSNNGCPAFYLAICKAPARREGQGFAGGAAAGSRHVAAFGLMSASAERILSLAREPRTPGRALTKSERRPAERGKGPSREEREGPPETAGSLPLVSY